MRPSPCSGAEKEEPVQGPHPPPPSQKTLVSRAVLPPVVSLPKTTTKGNLRNLETSVLHHTPKSAEAGPRNFPRGLSVSDFRPGPRPKSPVRPKCAPGHRNLHKLAQTCVLVFLLELPPPTPSNMITPLLLPKTAHGPVHECVWTKASRRNQPRRQTPPGVGPLSKNAVPAPQRKKTILERPPSPRPYLAPRAQD